MNRELDKNKRIPRGLAFDMLFGSNSLVDGHQAIDIIYEHFQRELKDFESRTCEGCEYSYYYDEKDTEVSKECRLFSIECDTIGGCNKWEAKK